MTFINITLVQNYILPAIILLVSALLGLVWAISNMFSNSQLKAWVKNEVKELIVSGLILIIVFSIIASSDMLAQIFTGQPDLENSALASIYSFRSSFISPLKNITTANHYLGLMSGYSYSFAVPAFYVTFSTIQSPFAGVSPLSSMVSRANSATVNGIFVYTGLIVLLKFFMSSAKFFLPFALALRFIPFTRKIGGTLIALSIGALVIFPTAVLVDAELIHNPILTNIGDIKLDTVPMKFELPVDLTDYCSTENAMSNLFKDIVTFNIFGVTKDSIPIGLGLLKIGEMVYATATCIPTCSAANIGYAACFIGCYADQSMVIYNYIITMYEVTVGAVFIGVNVASNINGGDIAIKAIYEVLKPFLEGIIKLMVLSYVDILFVGIVTIVGTKGISGAFGGQVYLPMVERFLR